MIEFLLKVIASILYCVFILPIMIIYTFLIFISTFLMVVISALVIPFYALFAPVLYFLKMSNEKD